MERLNWALPVLSPGMEFLLLLAVAWSAIWKGMALWRAARNTHLVWFIVMLVVNTLGILEIIYILAFSKKKEPQTGS